ncbi:HTTM domain-containing protein [Stieleria sp. TO1_6]|nr:HTTM domain-containing protein [Stieleria tagensis]
MTFWFWASGFLQDDRWRIFFVQPILLFKYDYFRWVQIWPGDGIWWHFQIVRVAAVCFALGLLTRISGVLLSASMAYVLLVERQLYNNHDYLLACSVLICALLPSQRRFSIDRILFHRSDWPTTMRHWHWWLVRFQLGLPYCFGGIAKLNADWLAGQPAGLFCSAHVDAPVVGPLLAMPHAATIMAWGGLMFDLFIVPALLWKRTRPFAIVAALGFHLTNAMVFHIGVFPWFMIATLFVFFPIDFIPRLITRLGGKKFGFESILPPNDAHPSLPASTLHKLAATAAVIYVVIQLLLPIRPWVMPGDAGWNERGHRFSWRMMLRHKDCLLWFKLVTEKDFLFAPATMVMTPSQVLRAPRDPELIRQAAVKIKQLATEIGQPDCQVHALALVSLNGRPAKPIVDPEVDLTGVTRGWWYDDWVPQDPGPLPQDPWQVPPDQWWQSVDLGTSFSALKAYRPSQAQVLYDQLRQQELAKQPTQP